MNPRSTILFDLFLLLLLALAVSTNSVLLASIPLIVTWLVIVGAVIMATKPSTVQLQLPLYYHYAYDIIYITLLLVGSFTITAYAYVIVPLVSTYIYSKQSQILP